MEEVAEHNKKDNCWVSFPFVAVVVCSSLTSLFLVPSFSRQVVIQGQVLDVTDFLEDHPGGPSKHKLESQSMKFILLTQLFFCPLLLFASLSRSYCPLHSTLLQKLSCSTLDVKLPKSSDSFTTIRSGRNGDPNSQSEPSKLEQALSFLSDL